MSREQDMPTPQEIHGDLFDFELKALRKMNDSFCVLNVDVDENYYPFDPEYENETFEETLYEGFATGISFITTGLEAKGYFNGKKEVILSISERFDRHMDLLSSNYAQEGARKEAIQVQNLTMQGAADYAKKRYQYYLIKFIDKDIEPDDLIGYSQDVNNWMWTYLIFSHTAKIV